MIIRFYKNTSDNRVVSKNISQISETNCYIYDMTSICSPKIIIANNDDFPLNVNYAYIPRYKRYYYINDWYIDKGGRVILNLSIDVLMTFKNDILNLNCTIIRQENVGNNHIVDNLLQIKQKKDLKVVKLNNNELISDKINDSTYCYVLNVSGGGD